MPTYVHVRDGVCQGVTIKQAQPLPADYPGFPDWIDVTALSAIPQLGDTYSEGKWTAYPGRRMPPLSGAQASLAALKQFLAGGLIVTSTATPALNGKYAIDDAAQTSVLTEAHFITTFNEFTSDTDAAGRAQGLPWLLADGKASVTFMARSDFLNFAKVVAQTAAAAKRAAQNQSAMPSNKVTIP